MRKRNAPLIALVTFVLLEFAVIFGISWYFAYRDTPDDNRRIPTVQQTK